MVISDAVKSSVIALHLFGVVQRFFTLFAESVKCWKILTDHVKLTLKPLCDTRWEARIESVKVVRSELNRIKLALKELKEVSKGDPMYFSEASSLIKEITQFKFSICVTIWYNILCHINKVDKAVQKEDMQLDTTVNLINATITVIKEYSVDGFGKSKKEGEELMEFSYKSADEPILGEENRLRINFFNVVVDTAIISLKEKFVQLNDYYNAFSVILCDIKNLTKNKSNLKNSCKKLADAVEDPKTSVVKMSVEP